MRTLSFDKTTVIAGSSFLGDNAGVAAAMSPMRTTIARGKGALVT